MRGPYNVLFLCTGNSARSILAEAILSRESAGRFSAYSAGSFPKGKVQPEALRLLKELGFETSGVRSKSWEEFARAGAPEIDFIFTVCDNAANEICPIWPGHPITAHWGIEDPAAVGEPGQRRAFEAAFQVLKRRIDLFLALPIDSIDELALEVKLRQIGRTEDRQPAGA
jgi:arsenate reductase (thioredoxin)